MTVNHGSCDDGLFCNGGGDLRRAPGLPGGHSPGRRTTAWACTDDSCDEATDAIVNAR